MNATKIIRYNLTTYGYQSKGTTILLYSHKQFYICLWEYFYALIAVIITTTRNWSLGEALHAPVVLACILEDGHHSDQRGVVPPVYVPQSCLVRTLQMQGEYCESVFQLAYYP